MQQRPHSALKCATALALCPVTAVCLAEQLSHPSDHTDPCYASSDCYSVTVGSKAVDSTRLAPYHAIWVQQRVVDGKPTASPATFEERLQREANGHWLHTQIQRPGNGMAITGLRTLDGKTLALNGMQLQIDNGPAEQPTQVDYLIEADGHTGTAQFADGTEKAGTKKPLSMRMFDGHIGGISFASLPLAEGYTASLPMLIPNLGKYWIEAKVRGKKSIVSPAGESIQTWEVDAKWLNLGTGDIYPGGRDGSGGTYYIAIEPGNGVPPVVEYANENAVITWDGVRRTD